MLLILYRKLTENIIAVNGQHAVVYRQKESKMRLEMGLQEPEWTKTSRPQVRPLSIEL